MNRWQSGGVLSKIPSLKKTLSAAYKLYYLIYPMKIRSIAVPLSNDFLLAKKILIAILLLGIYICTYAETTGGRDDDKAINNVLLKGNLVTHSDSVRYIHSPIPGIASVVKSTKILFADNDSAVPVVPEDSLVTLIAKFYIDQYRHFQDPDAPSFMFMSRDAKMAFGVGGAIKLHGWYDWNGSVDSRDFSPYQIPVPKDPANRKRLGASAASSGLFFTLLGENQKFGDYMAYIQMEFSSGNNLGCHLKKAYLSFNHWTVGYASSTFSDPGAETPILDGGGLNGKVSKTQMLVRYMKNIKRWTLAGSLEFPSTSIQTNEFVGKSSQWLPDLSISGQYSWNNGLSHVKVSGMVRNITYRNLLTQKNKNVAGWGGMLSGTIATASPVTLYGIATIGEGHESYTSDLSKGDYDLIIDPAKPGRLYAPLASSLALGMGYAISPSVVATLAMSELTFHPQHSVDPTDYRRGLYAAANILWHVTPRLMFGGEYVWGQRKNFNNEKSSANRLDALLQLNF